MLAFGRRRSSSRRSRVGDDLALNTGWVAFQGSGLAIFKETYIELCDFPGVGRAVQTPSPILWIRDSSLGPHHERCFCRTLSKLLANKVVLALGRSVTCARNHVTAGI